MMSNLDPRHMEKSDCEKYTKLMFDNYIKKELDDLKPNTVIYFKGQSGAELKNALDEKTTLIEINDTASILYAPPYMKQGGSWFEEEAPDELKELLSILTAEKRFRHDYSRKEDLIRVYLKHYSHKFTGISLKELR